MGFFLEYYQLIDSISRNKLPSFFFRGWILHICFCEEHILEISDLRVCIRACWHTCVCVYSFVCPTFLARELSATYLLVKTYAIVRFTLTYFTFHTNLSGLWVFYCGKNIYTFCASRLFLSNQWSCQKRVTHL